ncbi:carboxylesterase/lipase family protein [Sphingomonas sp. Leaf343]|uniref:carboxylesterase/lipase family protein n=1 Tax=Sphingomonas sp. Leaf343 TaxID=1736345 RepID=UPI0006F96C9E|nr:carboxylesterase family protein [Sphingomonas sp. Leaf343]KQR82319.1 carboxylesterase [Sphingomonas sp. Leaf343]
MASSASPPIIIRTQAGELRGIVADGVRRFLSIPYAAPPTGARRFEPPQPVEPWAGIRDAVTAGANAPQRIREVPGLDVAALVGDGWVPGDDYLTLNVWRPDDDRGGLPVMVFVHGGGFVVGSKDAPVQDGGTFARDGVMCVAINYRMGLDGFLPIPGVPTNLGLRDILAAMEWVQREVAAFGGDPGNVTIFGESAGAMAIADLVTSPLAKGLFRRAIVQSGHGGMTRDIGVAQRLVAKMAKLLGVAATRDGFAAAPAEAVLDAIERVSLPTTRLDLRGPDGREPVFGISRFVPVHGDDVLPAEPLAALTTGAGAEIDVLIGSNAEEMNLYLVSSGVRDRIGRLIAWLALRRSQPRAWSVLNAYGAGRQSGGRALTDAMTDLVFRWPARRFAEEHRGRTHVYEFEWRSTAFGGELGAAHAVEIPFVFDTLATATGPEGLLGRTAPQELADRMHRLWIDFARDGSLPWPAFDCDTRQVYRVEAGTAAHEPAMPAAAYLP